MKLNLRKIAISIFFQVIAFVIFYYEYAVIAGIKWSVIWKAVVILAVIFYLLFTGVKSVSIISIIGVAYSIKCAISFSGEEQFFSNLVSSMKWIVIPLAMILIDKFRPNEEAMLELVIRISFFILISFIPFSSGVLEQKNAGYDLGIFGIDGSGIVGIFQVPHAASAALAISSLTFLYLTVNSKSLRYRLVYFFLLVGSFIFLVETYARMGVVAFIASALVVLIHRYGGVRVAIVTLIITLGAYGLVSSLDPTNVLVMRATGSNVYLEESGGGDLGSGRSSFAVNALSNWINSDSVSILFGLGESEAMDRMDRSIGMRVYAHNGFIDVIQFNGLIGIAIYSIFIFGISSRLLKSKSQYASLWRGIFVIYLAEMGLQGERFAICDVVFAVAFCGALRHRYSFSGK